MHSKLTTAVCLAFASLSFAITARAELVIGQVVTSTQTLSGTQHELVASEPGYAEIDHTLPPNIVSNTRGFADPINNRLGVYSQANTSASNTARLSTTHSQDVTFARTAAAMGTTYRVDSSCFRAPVGTPVQVTMHMQLNGALTQAWPRLSPGNAQSQSLLSAVVAVSDAALEAAGGDSTLARVNYEAGLGQITLVASPTSDALFRRIGYKSVELIDNINGSQQLPEQASEEFLQYPDRSSKQPSKLTSMQVTDDYALTFNTKIGDEINVIAQLNALSSIDPNSTFTQADFLEGLQLRFSSPDASLGVVLDRSSPIPEPGVLMIGGLAGLVLLRRTRM